jgi:hypothetical protein
VSARPEASCRLDPRRAVGHSSASLRKLSPTRWKRLARACVASECAARRRDAPPPCVHNAQLRRPALLAAALGWQRPALADRAQTRPQSAYAAVQSATPGRSAARARRSVGLHAGTSLACGSLLLTPAASLLPLRQRFFLRAFSLSLRHAAHPCPVPSHPPLRLSLRNSPADRGCGSGGEGPCAAGDDLLAGAALPNADGLALDAVLAAEGARVARVLRDLDLLDALAQRRTVARAVLARDTDLCADTEGVSGAAQEHSSPFHQHRNRGAPGQYCHACMLHACPTPRPPRILTLRAGSHCGKGCGWERVWETGAGARRTKAPRRPRHPPEAAAAPGLKCTPRRLYSRAALYSRLAGCGAAARAPRRRAQGGIASPQSAAPAQNSPMHRAAAQLDGRLRSLLMRCSGHLRRQLRASDSTLCGCGRVLSPRREGCREEEGCT